MEDLTSEQLSEWIAYNELDPIGSWREEYRTSRLESLISNIVTTLYHKKGTKTKLTTPNDFMPKFGVKHKQPVVDQQTLISNIKAAFGIITKEQNKKQVDKTRIPAAVRRKQNLQP